MFIPSLRRTKAMISNQFNHQPESSIGATGLQCQFVDANACFNVWLKGFGSEKRKLLTVGVAYVLWAIWKARTFPSFEHKWPSEPVKVLNRAVYWMDFWGELLVRESTKLELQLGTKLLGRVVAGVFQARRG